MGAACQTLNSTRAASGIVSMDFSVRYGPISYALVEVYTPHGRPGLYTKHAKLPGGRLLRLRTVVVDVLKDTCATPRADPRRPGHMRRRGRL